MYVHIQYIIIIKINRDLGQKKMAAQRGKHAVQSVVLEKEIS